MNSSLKPFVIGSIIYLLTYFLPFFPIIHFLEGESAMSTKTEISVTGFDLMNKSASIKGGQTEDKGFKKQDFIDRMYEVKYEKKEGSLETSSDKVITYPYFGWLDKLPTIGVIFAVLLIFCHYKNYYEYVYWVKIFLSVVIVLCFLRYGFINFFLNRQFTVFPIGIITLIISFILIVFDKKKPLEDSI